jgi:hypothetical protein
LVSYRFGVGQKYQPAALLLGLGKILLADILFR